MELKNIYFHSTRLLLREGSTLRLDIQTIIFFCQGLLKLPKLSTYIPTPSSTEFSKSPDFFLPNVNRGGTFDRGRPDFDHRVFKLFLKKPPFLKFKARLPRDAVYP